VELLGDGEVLRPHGPKGRRKKAVERFSRRAFQMVGAVKGHPPGRCIKEGQQWQAEQVVEVKVRE
jgi:hypothetical protein